MRFTPTLALVALASLVPVAAFAEPPAGSHSLTIGGSDSLSARLRLIEGVYTPDPECDNSNPTIEVCTSVEMHTNAAGAVTGTQTFTYTGDTVGEVRYQFEGQVKARPGLAKAKLLFTPEGTLSTNAGTETYSGRGKAFCRDDVVTGEVFSCSAKVQLCFENPIASDCNRLFQTIVVPEQRASWTLALDLATSGSGVVSGSAQAELANGVTIDFVVSGKYSAKTDLANLSLRGQGIASKSKVTIKKLAFDGVDLVAGRIKFKIADQVGAYDITPPAP